MKRGLKLVNYNYTLKSDQVEESSPMKRGLKRCDFSRFPPSYIVEESSPMKRGLKPDALDKQCPRARR